MEKNSANVHPMLQVAQQQIWNSSDQRIPVIVRKAHSYYCDIFQTQTLSLDYTQHGRYQMLEQQKQASYSYNPFNMQSTTRFGYFHSNAKVRRVFQKESEAHTWYRYEGLHPKIQGIVPSHHHQSKQVPADIDTLLLLKITTYDTFHMEITQT